jgi:hypothetical protein
MSDQALAIGPALSARFSRGRDRFWFSGSGQKDIYYRCHMGFSHFENRNLDEGQLNVDIKSEENLLTLSLKTSRYKDIWTSNERRTLTLPPTRALPLLSAHSIRGRALSHNSLIHPPSGWSLWPYRIRRLDIEFVQVPHEP